MDKAGITIIGAGVIGLAIAAELSRKHEDIVLLEKESSFGQHTSSRNSEVIHAGIYYPKGSLKAKLCVKGNKMLYDFCEKHSVPYARLGKLIVAVNDGEVAQLEELEQRGKENGVNDLGRLSSAEVAKMEPSLKTVRALFSPSTGIVDSHILMKKLESQAEERGVIISYGSEVRGMRFEGKGNGYIINVSGEEVLQTEILINSAGLWADNISQMAFASHPTPHTPNYKIHYCKGEYFSYSKPSFLKHLIYPVPEQDIKGLGIHAVLDLAGGLKFGPNAEYVNEIDYKASPAHRAMFYNAIKNLYPMIKEADLSPDQAGIRPKLQGPGETFRDFVINEESENDFPGLINLIGIESPGLTSCLAIGKMVSDLIY